MIPIKPEHDKKTRMSIQTAKFESGRVLFPTHAPWLADFEDELCAFPRGRHDDQVDSVSQALAPKVQYAALFCLTMAASVTCYGRRSSLRGWPPENGERRSHAEHHAGQA